MVKREYDWENGAAIGDHSKIKLDILSEYLREYVRVRCSLPQQERFRLSFVDGFCGAGEYVCGTLGSPLMVLSALKTVSSEINFKRRIDGFKPISFEFFMYFNDLDPFAINTLREKVKSFLEDINNYPNSLKFNIIYLQGDFGDNFSEITSRIIASKVRNTIFNFDQYGHSEVTELHLKTALSLTRSSEVFLTFSIRSFLAFISPNKTQDTRIFSGKISEISRNKSKKEWLAAVERVVFEQFSELANFVSPFSINNPSGWEYWLVHFANSYRARQVYNDILHRKKNSQAHVGRSGLQMLRYSTIEEASIYLFDAASRQIARDELLLDIPRYIANRATEAPLLVSEFFDQIYNQTPAHSDDLNSALIKSPDVEVITSAGGKRRKPQLINRLDYIRLTPQRTFHFFDCR